MTWYGGSWWRILSVYVLDWSCFPSLTSWDQISCRWMNSSESILVPFWYFIKFVYFLGKKSKACSIVSRFSLLLILLKIIDTYFCMLHFVLSVFTFHAFIDLLLSIPQFIERMIKLGSQPLRKWYSGLLALPLLS